MPIFQTGLKNIGHAFPPAPPFTFTGHTAHRSQTLSFRKRSARCSQNPLRLVSVRKEDAFCILSLIWAVSVKPLRRWKRGLGNQENIKEAVSTDLSPVRSDAHSPGVAVRRPLMTLLRAISVAWEAEARLENNEPWRWGLFFPEAEL